MPKTISDSYIPNVDNFSSTPMHYSYLPNVVNTHFEPINNALPKPIYNAYVQTAHNNFEGVKKGVSATVPPRAHVEHASFARSG